MAQNNMWGAPDIVPTITSGYPLFQLRYLCSATASRVSPGNCFSYPRTPASLPIRIDNQPSLDRLCAL
jgi:hypothetical protein